MNHKPVH